MKVVHVITGLRSGGAERALVDHLALTRHQTQVLTLAADGRLADELREQGVPVTCMNLRSNRDLLGLLRLIRALRRLRPDVVHLHLYRALVFGRVATALLRLPVIATEHSAQPFSMERRRAGRLVKGLYRRTERLGGLTIAVSEETRQVLVEHWGIPAERVLMIPNGVIAERFVPRPGDRDRVRGELGIPADAPVSVSVCRLSREKRVELGLRLLTLPGFEDWHHVAVGTGVEAEPLQRLAEELGVADRTHLMGDQADIPGFLSAADVFLQLSDYETYGLSAIEALTSGLPVVYRTSPALDGLPADPWVVRVTGEEEPVAAAARAAVQHGRRPLPLPHEIAENVDVRRVARRLDAAEEDAARAARRPSRG